MHVVREKYAVTYLITARLLILAGIGKLKKTRIFLSFVFKFIKEIEIFDFINFRDCAKDKTCVLCYECFKNSKHVNHKYKVNKIRH